MRAVIESHSSQALTSKIEGYLHGCVISDDIFYIDIFDYYYIDGIWLLFILSIEYFWFSSQMQNSIEFVNCGGSVWPYHLL